MSYVPFFDKLPTIHIFRGGYHDLRRRPSRRGTMTRLISWPTMLPGPELLVDRPKRPSTKLMYGGATNVAPSANQGRSTQHKDTTPNLFETDMATTRHLDYVLTRRQIFVTFASLMLMATNAGVDKAAYFVPSHIRVLRSLRSNNPGKSHLAQGSPRQLHDATRGPSLA